MRSEISRAIGLKMISGHRRYRSYQDQNPPPTNEWDLRALPPYDPGGVLPCLVSQEDLPLGRGAANRPGPVVKILQPGKDPLRQVLSRADAVSDVPRDEAPSAGKDARYTVFSARKPIEPRSETYRFQYQIHRMCQIKSWLIKNELTTDRAKNWFLRLGCCSV